MGEKSFETEVKQSKKGWELVQGLTVLIVLIPSLHYYLSRRWYTHFFEVYNIDMLPLINSDDITFAFSSLNQWLILNGFIGFVWIALFRLALSDR